MAPTTDQPHMLQPEVTKNNKVAIVPALNAIAPTGRRPRVSAKRPPTTTPMPPGVFVSNVNAEMRAAEKPRSTLRYRFKKNDAGATNRLLRKPEMASSQKRRPCALNCARG